MPFVAAWRDVNSPLLRKRADAERVGHGAESASYEWTGCGCKPPTTADVSNIQDGRLDRRTLALETLAPLLQHAPYLDHTVLCLLRHLPPLGMQTCRGLGHSYWGCSILKVENGRCMSASRAHSLWQEPRRLTWLSADIQAAVCRGQNDQ